MTTERCESVMRTYLTEVIGNQRLDLIPSFTADDMYDHTQQELSGPAALEAHVRFFSDNIKNLKVDVLEVLAAEDFAVGIWKWSGETINAMGLNHSGEPIMPTHVASIFKFKNDMLVHYQPYLDAISLLTQVGAETS
jgi:hypothetical protein|tara:strand:+ start:548 stop:958 length:411 start_codon:yes stop_codon:yes gene_type:complete